MTSAPARGVFVLSLDFELAWGSRDLVEDTGALEEEARITREQAFEALLELLEEHGIVATWATVGHLFLDGGGLVEGDEESAPAWYGRSLVERLRDAGQEVGSHSFSHPIFGDCPREVAAAELARCVAEARALGIALRSFVFPRNVPAHIDLLVEHGFTCWRPPEPAWYRRLPGPARRLAHLADVIRAATPPTVLPERDARGLWEIPASATFLPYHGVRRRVPLAARELRSTRGLDAAVDQSRVFHLYLHPINLAADPPAMLAALGRVFGHAARLRDAGELEILPMAALAERAAAA